MAIGNSKLLEIIQNLTSDDPDTRDDACGTVTDLVQSFDSHETTMISSTLATLAASETNKRLRESELHALVELGDSPHFDPQFVGPLNEIDRSTLVGSEIEYFEYFDAEYFNHE
ncbi:hypothetical protein [Nocardia cyriacigeorgica]|jgi:hypothetical protein|uniref:hypothetical protein n=1 Tax=Nocardia cyriacigeorgica TaxID=135487 RepID=UPI000CEA0781|nr:hypothetical protein [Nocardia cyriacigeorgica]AVH22121.1 hypothetical protein C5B73_12370 [Nocardia cyriacigeorgica]MBF6097804.1 hypothetical protein [Nocardia cyriacigeorgica]MBF6321689.1 hypothetical protein [Nocardia cyriacigeorgica]PPJ11668.1 hypothetical protein C5E43_12310 [Nocardia cyriacigeorgica]